MSEKALKPSFFKCELVTHLITTFGLSIRQACRYLNQSWSVDFMLDALVYVRRSRTFNVVDDFNREVLSIEIDLKLTATLAVRVLDRIVVKLGYPFSDRSSVCCYIFHSSTNTTD